MADLKRKIEESRCDMHGIDSVNCVYNECKHPRLLMDALKRQNSTSKRLVIEFPVVESQDFDPVSMQTENMAESTLGDARAKNQTTERRARLSTSLSTDRYQQLVSYAKTGLDTDHLPTNSTDAFSAQKLCALRLQYLTELMQKGEEVRNDLIIKNLQYAKKVLDVLPTVDRNQPVDVEDDLEVEVQPDAVPSEVREWLAQTFTKAPANAPSTRSKSINFKSVANVVRAGLIVDKLYRRTTSLSPDQRKPPPEEVSSVLKHVNRWEFDIWRLNTISENRSLRYIGFDVIHRENLLNKLKINPACLDNFLASLEVGYSKANNPYHNLIHGADVTQTTYYLLHQSKLMNWLSDLEHLAVLFAALIHDYEHTGTTNNYHIVTRSRLAQLYNDKSVLENHHLSAAFELMKKEERNILANIKKDDYPEFRALVIDMVLATDMTNHFSQVNDMKAMLASPQSIKRPKVLSLLLHAADISHPAKPWSMHKPWTDKLIEEFFNQGDSERELGLPCSPLCDRNNTPVEESQIVFIEFIVQPTFKVLGDMLEAIRGFFIPPSANGEDVNKIERPWERHLELNKKHWQRLDKSLDENDNCKRTATVKKSSNQPLVKDPPHQASEPATKPNVTA